MKKSHERESAFWRQREQSLASMSARQGLGCALVGVAVLVVMVALTEEGFDEGGLTCIAGTFCVLVFFGLLGSRASAEQQVDREVLQSIDEATRNAPPDDDTKVLDLDRDGI